MLLLAITWLFSGCSSNEPELHIYAWSNYISPTLIEQFEKENHCRVVINTFDTNESMFAKLSLGSSGYDVIFPSNYFADLMHELNLLQKIEATKLPNLKYVDDAYTKLLTKETTPFAIPYTITTTSIGYRKDKVTIDDPCWNIFQRENLKGRMTMLNDPRETLGSALKYLGFSINTVNPLEITKAEKVLIEWKKNLAKFESEQYKNGLASAEYLVVQGYAGEIMLVHNENKDVIAVIPKEGTIVSIDMLTVPNDAPNPDLAFAFINFLLEPKNALTTILYTQFLVANTAAYDLLPDHLKKSHILFPEKSILEKSELIRNLGEKTSLYNEAWDRVKAY